jgi:hypothetical protein
MLRVTSDAGPVPAEVEFRADGATVTPSLTQTEGNSTTVALAFMGKKTVYKAVVPGTPDVESNEVTVEPDDDGAVAEVAVGQYDATFSVVAGALVTALVAVILVFAGLARVDSLSSGAGAGDAAGATTAATTTEDSGADAAVAAATIEQRVRAVVLVLLMAIGAVVVVLGGMMALLEVRGRLRRPKDRRQVQVFVVQPALPFRDVRYLGRPETNFAVEGVRTGLAMRSGAIPAVGAGPLSGGLVPIGQLIDSGSEAFAGGLGAARRARGTVITLVIGLFILLLAFLGSSSFDFSIGVGDGADGTTQDGGTTGAGTGTTPDDGDGAVVGDGSGDASTGTGTDQGDGSTQDEPQEPAVP